MTTRIESNRLDLSPRWNSDLQSCETGLQNCSFLQVADHPDQTLVTYSVAS